MLEQIIIRKPFLKKHLAAPLLKERESFLTMKSKEEWRVVPANTIGLGWVFAQVYPIFRSS